MTKIYIYIYILVLVLVCIYCVNLLFFFHEICAKTVVHRPLLVDKSEVLCASVKHDFDSKQSKPLA
jgi:hypothetical protein